jgi:outer membrane protein assembly factor BamB
MGKVTVRVSVILWLLALATVDAADEFPQWRGPKRDGQIVGFKLPAAWPAELEKLWQVEVGLGHSSPVVHNRKIYQFSRRGDDEVLACLDLADGKELWKQGYAAPYQMNPVAVMHGKGTKSTPVVADGRVFTLGISGVVTARDAKTGRQLWQREFSKQFSKTSPLYGAAMSPAVFDGKCIVHVGGHDKGALVALDVKNGETIWSWNEDGPGYASPVLVTLDDVRQVVTQSQKACVGVELASGKLLWRIPFQTEYDQNSVTPIEHEGSLIFSGINQGVDRYRIEKTDDEWETDKVWGEKEVSFYMSSPVADAHRLFGFSHRHKGEFFALDLTTGKTLWTSEGRQGENAALLQTGNVLWALTNSGELIVFKASDKQFEPLARYKVSETPTWAHPAILSSGVLIKDESTLALRRFPKTPLSSRLAP